MMRNDPRFANNPMLQQQMQQLANNPAAIQKVSQMMQNPQMMQQMQSMMAAGRMGCLSQRSNRIRTIMAPAATNNKTIKR